MSLLAQCGYGRGSKIESGLSENVIEGVIMSPRDERRERLEASIVSIKEEFPNSKILFDPQFYASTINNPNDGRLNEYPYYENNYELGRTDFSGSNIRSYVEQCLIYQHETLNSRLSYIVSPTIMFDSFNDYWSQIAISMAIESLNFHGSLNNPKPLLVSLVISESAFLNEESMNEFLDIITEIDTFGFYIILKKNSNATLVDSQNEMFARFMYFCHVLSEINDYDITAGFCDWQSFLLSSVGVSNTANGWFQNLKYFDISRYDASRGGRTPRKRYSSLPLLSDILINPEMQNVFLADSIDVVLSGSNYDKILKNGPASAEDNWTREIACLEHWFCINKLEKRIKKHETLDEKILEVHHILNNTMKTMKYLKKKNLYDANISIVKNWKKSFERFCTLIGFDDVT